MFMATLCDKYFSLSGNKEFHKFSTCAWVSGRGN